MLAIVSSPEQIPARGPRAAVRAHADGTTTHPARELPTHTAGVPGRAQARATPAAGLLLPAPAAPPLLLLLRRAQQKSARARPFSMMDARRRDGARDGVRDEVRVQEKRDARAGWLLRPP